MPDGVRPACRLDDRRETTKDDVPIRAPDTRIRKKTREKLWREACGGQRERGCELASNRGRARFERAERDGPDCAVVLLERRREPTALNMRLQCTCVCKRLRLGNRVHCCERVTASQLSDHAGGGGNLLARKRSWIGV